MLANRWKMAAVMRPATSDTNMPVGPNLPKSNVAVATPSKAGLMKAKKTRTDETPPMTEYCGSSSFSRI